MCDGFVNIGLDRHPTKIWNDECDIHGVGTKYFQKLKVKPFGYADEATTTREEWMLWKELTEYEDGQESAREEEIEW